MSDPKSLQTITQRVLPAVAAAWVLLLASAIGAPAADSSKADAVKRKPMNMEEPMAGGMKREGMKTGDVKKAAAKWDRKMRKMIDREQQSAATVKK